MLDNKRRLDILPDSRPRERRGSIPSKLGAYIPIYCANCGRPYGMVPETMITFAFALCQPCADKGIGDLAHFYQEPDAVFWERVKEAQLEEYGELLDAARFAQALDEPSSPLAKLAEEYRRNVLKKEM